MDKVAIITGKERRRRWGEAEKMRLVAETLAPGAVVAHVARRHEVAESCLHAWRRQLRDEALADVAAEAGCPPLIPISVEAPSLGRGREPLGMIPPPIAPPPRGRAVVTLPNGIRLEIDADCPASAVRTLLAALQGRR